MSYILTISGSTRAESSNARLLRALARSTPQSAGRLRFEASDSLAELPLFSPERLAAGPPDIVLRFAERVRSARAVVIATPEYAHNLPAAVKSALEWTVSSGEFAVQRGVRG